MLLIPSDFLVIILITLYYFSFQSIAHRLLLPIFYSFAYKYSYRKTTTWKSTLQSQTD